VGQALPAGALNTSLLAIYSLSASSGPLMADRTVTNAAHRAEFHVWPSTAAGAWFLLAQARPTLYQRDPDVLAVSWLPGPRCRTGGPGNCRTGGPGN
jgi:hypothetical protein